VALREVQRGNVGKILDGMNRTAPMNERARLYGGLIPASSTHQRRRRERDHQQRRDHRAPPTNHQRRRIRLCCSSRTEAQIQRLRYGFNDGGRDAQSCDAQSSSSTPTTTPRNNSKSTNAVMQSRRRNQRTEEAQTRRALPRQKHPSQPWHSFPNSK